MVQTKKLSLAELKLKASTIEGNEVLEKIQGGVSSDCHSPKSKMDQIEDRFYQQVDKIFDWLF
ncbi:hypothetical protein HDE69_000594 [Pedobacter cryoconitis]|uniref:Uncharacterized protein n=1 Tax=Pedobacter cryoconitis TaxID=188932 RepID=A0A7W8YQ84_9SPHI|nr:hypothetical protein [Pedobacter cryoconitis]MBB5619558.1 hypothetical protein [Pedobacter cryoconitis]